MKIKRINDSHGDEIRVDATETYPGDSTLLLHVSECDQSLCAELNAEQARRVAKALKKGAKALEARKGE